MIIQILVFFKCRNIFTLRTLDALEYLFLLLAAPNGVVLGSVWPPYCLNRSRSGLLLVKVTPVYPLLTHSRCCPQPSSKETTSQPQPGRSDWQRPRQLEPQIQPGLAPSFSNRTELGRIDIDIILSWRKRMGCSTFCSPHPISSLHAASPLSCNNCQPRPPARRPEL